MSSSTLLPKRILLGFIAVYWSIGVPVTDARSRALGAAAPAPDRALQLEIHLNGVSTGLIGAFQQDAGGVFWTKAEELGQAGLNTRWLVTDARGLVRLDRISGVTFLYDEPRQTLALMARPDALALTRIGGARKAAVVTPTASSAILNYALHASIGGVPGRDGVRFEGVSGAFDARVSGRYGAFGQAFLARAGAGLPRGALRLDTSWSHEDPERMLVYNVGDLVTREPEWGRSIRMGGVQVSRRFELRPDLVTMPLPAITGTAQTPSTLDLYLNDVKALSAQVPAGPYEVTRAPVVYGAGAAQVVLRDALGRETTTTLPFYASPHLLAPGLLDFAAQLGFARRNYGASGADYDSRLAGSAAFRYGLSPAFTLEGRTEIASRLVLLGAGAVLSTGDMGVVSTALTVSDGQGRAGGRADISMEAQRGPFVFGAALQRSTPDFEDLSSLTAIASPLDPFNRAALRPARALDRALVSAPLGPFGTHLSANYTRVHQGQERIRALGLSLSQDLGRVAASLSAVHDLTRRESFRIQLGLTAPLRREVVASAAVEGGRGAGTISADVARQAEGNGFGWRLRSTEGEFQERAAQATWMRSYGQFDAAVHQLSGLLGASAQASGSLAMIGGQAFIARRLDGAFALVDTGTPGLKVRHENRPVGETDRRGLLLIPDLVAYQPNRIEVDPSGLPVDADMDLTAATVTPRSRAGSVLRMKARSTTDAALVGFSLPDGQPLQPGLKGRMAGGEAFVVGYDGEAYLRGLRQRNEVAIQLADGRTCTGVVDFAPKPGRQVRVPRAVCRPPPGTLPRTILARPSSAPPLVLATAAPAATPPPALPPRPARIRNAEIRLAHSAPPPANLRQKVRDESPARSPVSTAAQRRDGASGAHLHRDDRQRGLRGAQRADGLRGRHHVNG